MVAAAVGSDDGDGPDTAVAKAAAGLRRLVLHVVDAGVGPLAGSAVYGDDRRARSFGDADVAVRRIIRESRIAAGSNGFVTGLGGIVVMPVTIPANVAGSLFINARMTGAIAHLRGYELGDPLARALIPLVVAGSSVQAALAGLGIKAGTTVVDAIIKALPIAAIRAINRRVGFYLLAKYGTQRAAVTLAKAVPFVGGVTGGTIDYHLTGLIGRRADATFRAEPHPTTEAQGLAPDGDDAAPGQPTVGADDQPVTRPDAGHGPSGSETDAAGRV